MSALRDVADRLARTPPSRNGWAWQKGWDAAVREVIRAAESEWLASPATGEGLDVAWKAAETAVARHKPGCGFGVEADGPGYRAHAGHPEWHGGYVESWSVDDPELVGDSDHPATPAKALLKLAARLAATTPDPGEAE